MKKSLHKTVDIMCIALDLAFAIISLPFKLLKAIIDIAAVIKRKTA